MESPSVSNVSTVLQHAIVKEMHEEFEYLCLAFRLGRINLCEVKSAIEARCKNRALENNGTALSFSALSEGHTNSLYGDIVTLLFNPKNVYELLKRLSPHTKKKITVSLDTSLDVSYLNATSRVRR